MLSLGNYRCSVLRILGSRTCSDPLYRRITFEDGFLLLQPMFHFFSSFPSVSRKVRTKCRTT